MSEDASATYRGFRNQALYALHRLLTDRDSSRQIYRPEGAEDLAIFDSQLRLIEVVQVKDYSSDLALSHFKPKSEQGFFARFDRRRSEHPSCVTKLATFGPLGPELRDAIEGNVEARASVLEKLCASNSKITPHKAAAMLESLRMNVLRPVAADLMTSVIESLRGSNVAGELQRTVELLMFWVFEASEKKLNLTRQGLLTQLDRIGSYLAALRDTSSEWWMSVSPVRSAALTRSDSERLIAEYRRGVQARWEHILAGADCLRTERLQEIHQKLQRRSVVIVRGASGQGKSTIGWRYLHDFCEEGLRFHVHMVEGREHAMRIANALGAHVRRLNLSAIAYLDISPTDAGWSELVRELVSAGLRVLIAVREEDFRRANIAAGDFDYLEVVLDRVAKVEAQSIFSALQIESGPKTLDFEDVWARFGSEGGGPLLEFTYLVTEGESLASRIAAQVQRIQSDAGANTNGITNAHLDLLALAAVANATGARVLLDQLYESINIHPLARPIKVLESEYLLRTQDEGGQAVVAGLHILRSKAIADALFVDAPLLREKYVVQVLPYIIAEDCELFLLSVFSQLPAASDLLFEQLCKIVPRSWTHTGGIVRALIWEGLNRYERSNRDVILFLMNKFGSAWWIACDSFVGMNEDNHRQLLETMNDVLKANIEAVPLTPKKEVFDLLHTWASTTSPPSPPQRPNEWTNAGDVAHWLGRRGIYGPLRAGIEKLLPSPLPAELHVEELGSFVSGRAQLGDEAFGEWHRSEQANISQLFIRETRSMALVDEKDEVKVFFPVPLADAAAEGKSGSHDWHEQTMRRIRLLRLLFPDRKKFASQGVGLEFVFPDSLHNPTIKNIPIENLPLERDVRLNSVFSSLVAYRHNRPDTWRQYVAAAFEFRKVLSEFLRKLHRGWSTLLSESIPRPNTIKQLPGPELDRLNKLSKLPLFPRSAVDEWGFLSEEKQNEQETYETIQGRSLRRFDRWRKSFQDFESAMGMVTSKIVDLTVLYLAETKGHVVTEGEEKPATLLLANLDAAWTALRPMQREFRNCFGGLVGDHQLDELEAYEKTNFRHVWFVAFRMRYERQRHLPNSRLTETENDLYKKDFLRRLGTELTDAMGNEGSGVVREQPWIVDGIPHLCIVCDYNSLDLIETIAPRVVLAVWRAAQATKWRQSEWKPLEIEWPKVAIVNLLRGKALSAACAATSTMIFFQLSRSFEVQLHHYAALPIKAEDFANGGFTIWENPLLSAILSLHGTVLGFVLTNSRFYHLAKVVLNEGLSQDESIRIFSEFLEELLIVANAARRSYIDAIQILDSLEANDKYRWKADLINFCQLLLIDLNEEAAVSLDWEVFTAWAEHVQSVKDAFQSLISAITTFAVTEKQ